MVALEWQSKELGYWIRVTVAIMTGYSSVRDRSSLSLTVSQIWRYILLSGTPIYTFASEEDKVVGQISSQICFVYLFLLYLFLYCVLGSIKHRFYRAPTEPGKMILQKGRIYRMVLCLPTATWPNPKKGGTYFIMKDIYSIFSTNPTDSFISSLFIF